MRVLHAIPSLTGGGAERQVSYLVPALLSEGVDAHLAYVQSGPNLEHLSEVGENLHRMDAVGNHSVRRYTNLSALINRLAPDVVQTWLPQMDILGGIAAMQNHTHFVLSERNSAGLYGRSPKAVARKFIGGRASAIVANSQAGLEYWNQGNTNQIRRVIRNGIPIEDIRAEARAGNDDSGEPPIILFAGRYTEQKNVILTLQAVIRVLGLYPEACAVFFGAGRLEHILLEIALGSSVGDRITIGPYSHSLWEWMGRASALVSLSKFEGMPNVALEAAAAGCPLVLSDISAHRELFSESCARFLTGPTVENTSSALADILDKPGRARDRSDAAKKVAEEMSIERSAAAYRALYDELLERRDINKKS